VVQTLALLSLTEFHRPVLSRLVAPLVAAGVGPEVLHYPGFFLVLPQIYSRVNLALDLVAGSLIFGAAVLILWTTATGRATTGEWAAARRRWPALFLLRLPVVLLPVLFYAAVPALAGEAAAGQATLIRTVRYGGFLMAVVAEALFLYGPLAMLARGRPLGAALRETVALAVKVPLATLLIVLVPNLAHLPLAAAMRRTQAIAVNLTPETVGWLLFLSILVYVAVTYLSLASAVRVYGARASAAEGGRP